MCVWGGGVTATPACKEESLQHLLVRGVSATPAWGVGGGGTATAVCVCVGGGG